MSDKETLSVYAAKAAEYAGLVESSGRDKNLDAFIALLPPGGHVLDWGCGAGNASAKLRDLGFQVTATDAAQEFALQARKAFALEVQVETFDELSDIDTYDGIWANFSLLHARKTAMPKHLKQAHKALKPGGQFSIGLKTGDGEHRDGIGRFYAYYTQAEIKALLHNAGFTVTDQSTGETIGLDGTVAPWIVLRAHA